MFLPLQMCLSEHTHISLSLSLSLSLSPSPSPIFFVVDRRFAMVDRLSHNLCLLNLTHQYTTHHAPHKLGINAAYTGALILTAAPTIRPSSRHHTCDRTGNRTTTRSATPCPMTGQHPHARCHADHPSSATGACICQNLGQTNTWCGNSWIRWGVRMVVNTPPHTLIPHHGTPSMQL